MKYCKRCGLKVDDMTSLCPKCGGMDFISEEEKARMSNGQTAPNRRPAQNPGMGANRPVRPNGTQPARPMQGQQGQSGNGQQRPMQGQGGQTGQRPMNGQQMGGQGQRPMNGQRPMQGQGGQTGQRPMQGQRPVNPNTQDFGGYTNNNQEYNQNNMDTMDMVTDYTEEQDVFDAEMPETVEDAKKRKKKEKAAKPPKAPADPSVVTMGGWLILWFKLIVPILNIVCIIQILTDKNGKYNESIKNYVKAYLIMAVIGVIAGIGGSFALASLLGSML